MIITWKFGYREIIFWRLVDTSAVSYDSGNILYRFYAASKVSWSFVHLNQQFFFPDVIAYNVMVFSADNVKS